MKKTIVSLLAVSLTLLSTPSSNAAQKFKSCAALNAVYAYGVGLEGAKDMVRGKPKESLHTVDNTVYEANKKKLDRDKDGIACEKQ